MAKKHRSYEPSRNRARVELRAVRVVRDEDTDPDVSYLTQADFRGRLLEYQKGKLHFYEMRVEADVELEGGVRAVISSTGVSGIESDTTEEELDDLIVEEWRSLRTALKTVGVPTAELPLEVDRAWIEWRT
jgi:hypothetical protein